MAAPFDLARRDCILARSRPERSNINEADRAFPEERVPELREGRVVLNILASLLRSPLGVGIATVGVAQPRVSVAALKGAPSGGPGLMLVAAVRVEFINPGRPGAAREPALYV